MRSNANARRNIELSKQRKPTPETKQFPRLLGEPGGQG